MMRSMLAGMLFLGAAGVAVAQDQVPDFTGTWSGDFEVILMGRDPGSEGQVVKVTVTYELANQNGRLVWGEVSSDKTEKRPVVLAFSLNNGTLLGLRYRGIPPVDRDLADPHGDLLQRQWLGLDLRELRRTPQGAIGGGGALTG